MSGRPGRFTAKLALTTVVMLALGGGAAADGASGPALITSCANDSQLQAAAAAGGSYVFAVPCTITLTKPLTITKDFSLDAGGYQVSIGGPTGGSGRAFTVEGGDVTLTGVSFSGQLDGFGALGTQGGAGASGGPGGAGSNVAGGAMLIGGGARVTLDGGSDTGTLLDKGTLNSAGGNGGSGGGPASSGGPGGNGGPGGRAGTAQGGGIYVSPGASLVVNNAQIDGFISTEGGFGGDGAPAGPGAFQGDGGPGAAAGTAQGGGIYNAGTVTLESARVANSSADSDGGAGGNCCVNGYGGSSAASGGAAGGDGAPAANALGGAIYNTGTLYLDGASLQFDSVLSRGGGGGSTSYVGTPGAGASSNAAEGGAIYTTKSLPDACVTYGNNSVSSQGGPGGHNYSKGTQAESGKAGPALGADVEAVDSATVHPCQTEVSVSDAFVHEPADGDTTDAKFTVSLNDASAKPVTVDYATKDGTATVGHGDYKATSGTLTFEPGQATDQTVQVPVYGTGLTKEARFSLLLSSPSGVTLEKSVGIGTIETGSLQIIPDGLPDGDTGAAYSTRLDAVGGAPPYTWNVAGGSLPDGLVLDPLTGVISGTPSKDGKFTFTVQATDSASPAATDEAQFTIAIGVAITSISPAGSGSQGGGSITVSDYGFDKAPDKLAFCPSGQTSDCVAADNVELASDTSLTATIPEESSPIKAAGGKADVFVDQGGTNHSDSVPFTYGLQITSISPNGSGSEGGDTITITGYGFDFAPDVVAFCPSGQTSDCVAASDANVKSDTTITATIPEESGPIKAAGGEADVFVDQGGTNHSNAVAFAYGLHINSIKPNTSAPAGGGQITVTGYGFLAAPDTLAFCPSGQTSGCVAATGVDVQDDFTITATIPEESSPIEAADGKADVIVDQGGTNHSNSVPFTYTGRTRIALARPATRSLAAPAP